MTECKYCNSKNLILEARVKGQDIMTANQVALKCGNCGKWLKWCPKDERKRYFIATKQAKEVLDEQSKQIEEAQQDIESLTNACNYYFDENKKLKQQLADKEKEIKFLKLDLGMYASVNEFLNRYGIEKAREVLLQTEKTKKQLKIEFAIAELEKVKSVINASVRDDHIIWDFDIKAHIDYQINELKKI